MGRGVLDLDHPGLGWRNAVEQSRWDVSYIEVSESLDNFGGEGAHN